MGIGRRVSISLKKWLIISPADFYFFKKVALLDNWNNCNLVASSGHRGGDWLGKLTNIKAENNDAVVYAGSFLTEHNPFFFSQIVAE